MEHPSAGRAAQSPSAGRVGENPSAGRVDDRPSAGQELSFEIVASDMCHHPKPFDDIDTISKNTFVSFPSNSAHLI